MPKHHKSVIGEKFNRLTVVSEYKNDKYIFAKCLCECGVFCEARRDRVISGEKKSCGCLLRENQKAFVALDKKITHGMTYTDEYMIWTSMKRRCKTQNRYTVKNIKVCKEWDESFEAFYSDMGNRPSKEHSIDRINNNEGYYKDNCRWADRSKQSLNKGLRTNNETGIMGIRYDKRRDKYLARVTLNGEYIQLYWGKSKFGAIRARVRFNRIHNITC